MGHDALKVFILSQEVYVVMLEVLKLSLYYCHPIRDFESALQNGDECFNVCKVVSSRGDVGLDLFQRSGLQSSHCIHELVGHRGELVGVA